MELLRVLFDLTDFVWCRYAILFSYVCNKYFNVFYSGNRVIYVHQLRRSSTDLKQCDIKLASLLFFILFWVTVLTSDSASNSFFISNSSVCMLSMCCSSFTNDHKDPLFTSSRMVSLWTRVLRIFYFRWDCGVSGFWFIAGRFGVPSNMED